MDETRHVIEIECCAIGKARFNEISCAVGVLIKLAYSEMQYAIALEMKYKRLRYRHSLAEAVVLQKQFTTALSSCCADHQSRLISLSPSSESLAPSSDSFVNPTNAITLPCTATILSAILESVIGCVCKTSTTHVRCHYAQVSEKTKSLY